jgi:hypothetical protein
MNRNGIPQSVKTIRSRDRIRYRDIVWAFFSDSQEILLGASIDACGGRMLWKDARAMGIFLWLNGVETLVSKVLFSEVRFIPLP